MPKSQVQLNYEQLWRVANAKEGGIEIPCRSKAEAVRTRYQLYNAVAWVKKPLGGEMADKELFEAVMSCELTLVGEKKDIVHVRRKMDNPAMQEIIKAIGGHAPDLEATALSKMAQRMLEVQREADTDPYAKARQRLDNPSGSGESGDAE